ncbi:MAG: membrane-bound O-acyltransferase family protein [Solirubrobacterales bacterium]|nr:MAG: membrane-bound O-acyltransferase family protein [Solirubrobacterales bacterium]
MSFASPIFLWYFMPALLVVVWLTPRSARNLVVALFSLLFYVWGAGTFVFLLLACIAVNYAAGRLVEPGRGGASERSRKLWLAATASFDVGILAIWKYGTFAQQQFHALVHDFGGSTGSVLRIALPIGISFFTFHHLSYVIDVYRGVRPAQRHPVAFVTYIAMFPQLIAGPIVRYHEIADQLPERRPDRLGDFAAGFPRFAHGLAKKVIVADSIGPIADSIFALSSNQLTTPAAWLGALAYALQIYFDFSGYSDMAIGLGRMLGFRLPENFARPYSAVSITDFWRRWHMSLSRWFRDYLYIPLGGNRGSAGRTYFNLYLVFALVGFWHGANWTFLIWGLYHGSWLVLERVTGYRSWADERLRVLRRLFTYFVVVVGWVFFRAPNLHAAGSMLQAMFVPRFGPLPDTVTAAANTQRTLTFALALLVVLIPGRFVLGRFLEASTSRIGSLARVGVTAVAAPYAAVLVAAGTFSPFLYFRF